MSYQDQPCNIMGCLPMGASLEPGETSNSPTLITFTISNTLQQVNTYQAEEGMTWSEWVNSKYNTIGAYINYGKVFLTAQYRIGGEGETYVNATSNIVENGTYSYMAGGAD